MLEELHTASSLLCAALDRYASACSALENGLSHKHCINNTVELSDTLADEIAQVESYSGKLAQAQAAVKRARNNQAHVPINSLPPEVLTQIFHLVSLNKGPCPLRQIDIWDSEHEPHFPDHPDLLSHVCSRWRQIALSSPELWSHIDIALSCSRSKGFHGRAAVHASRARQVPLNIHFVDPGRIREVEESFGSEDEDEEDEAEDNVSVWNIWDQEMWDNNPSVFAFLTSPATCIQSLGLLLHYYYHPIHSRAIEHCLANCLPGSLTELVIHMPSWRPSFFETSTNVGDRGTTGLVLSEQQLERALHSVTILNLRGKYPQWTSTAYHGLTDLRLLGGKDISVLELTGILRSSPGLRTIHCGSRIVYSPGSSASNTVVTLPELERLELKGMNIEGTEQLIKLLAPGPKLSRLSFRCIPTPAMLQVFFAYSSIQELRIAAGRQMTRSVLPPEAFCLPPQLQVLVMSDWSWGSSTEHKEETPPIQLDTVYMLRCRYEKAQQFRKAVAHLSPRRLVLWGCMIGSPGRRKGSPSVFKSALGEDLSKACAIEYLTDKDPNPVPDWN